MRAVGTLESLLDEAAFAEWHHGVLPASRDTVFSALQRLRWTDLRLAKPMLLARGLGLGKHLDAVWLEAFAGAYVFESRPSELGFVTIGRPWSLVPHTHPVSSVDEVRAFDGGCWLKYGMAWHLTALPGERTFVETVTLCQPTDDRARRRFAPYWRLIRPGSGLIRREMIGALRRATSG